MGRILTILVLVSSPVLLTGQSASGAEKLITTPSSDQAPQQPAAPPSASVEAPEQPGVPQPAFTIKGTSGPPMVLGVSEGTRLRLRSAPKTVFIADAAVADVQFDPPDVIYVFAKAPGSTALYASDKAGNIILNTVIKVGGPVSIIRGATLEIGGQPAPTPTTVTQSESTTSLTGGSTHTESSSR